MPSSKRMGTRAFALLIISFLTIVIGCASKDFNTFDQEAFEELVPSLLVPDNPEIVTSIKCPTFEETQSICTADIAETEISFIVEGPDSSGQINLISEFGLIWATDIGQKVKAQLDSDLGISNQVMCSPNVRIAQSGESFSCIVTDPYGGSRSFVADIQDTQGNFHLRLDIEN